MSETKPIYSGEAVLLNWHDAKSGRKIVLQLEKYAPGAHPFDGLDGERFAVVIVGPLAPAEHAEPVSRKGKEGGVPTRKDGRAETDPSVEAIASAPHHSISDDGSSSTTLHRPPVKPKRRWQDMPASQRAALWIKEPDAWAYIREACGSVTVDDEVAADAWLKRWLEIKSKSDLDADPILANRFKLTEEKYQAWRQARGHGVI